jgi:hypothetical protein
MFHLILTTMWFALLLLGLSHSANATTTVLYDGTTGFSRFAYFGLGVPNERRLIYVEVPLPLSHLPSATGYDIGHLNTDIGKGESSYIGYGNYGLKSFVPTFQLGLLKKDFPQLKRDAGILLTFNVAVLAEHSTFNRAGFNVLLLANDNKGIELSFRTEPGGRIFAQSATFDAAETVAFDVSQATTYELHIKGDNYTLNTGGKIILTGPVRAYQFDPKRSNPPLPLNPYQLPNFLFFGDASDKASAHFKLGSISITVNDQAQIATNPNKASKPHKASPL